MLRGMSDVARQALFLALGGILIVVAALRLARSHLLSARYAVGWMGVGVLIAGAAALMPFVGRIGRLADMSPTAVLLVLSSAALLVISIQLSISVSQLQARLRALAEAHALLEYDFDHRHENA
jgi:hypothetical protein